MRLSITSLAGSVYRRRWWFIMAWLVMLVASAFFAPRLSEVTSGGGFDLPESESWRAADILQSQFGRGYRRTVQVVYRHPALKVSDPDMEMRSSPGPGRGWHRATNRITFERPAVYGADGSATYALLSYSGSEEKIQPLVPRIRELAMQDGELETHVIGGPAVDYDMEKTSESDLLTAETYSLPLILIILLLVFGTVVAASLPLVLGIASVGVVLALLFLLGHWIPLSVFSRNIVTMIGLGLGVDYCLFIVSRFREELAIRGSVQEALEGTLDTAGRAVVFSGAAVVVGLAMLTVQFRLYAIFGYRRNAGCRISVLLAITLLPALLSIIGKGLFSPRLPAWYLLAGGGRFWHAWSRQVMRHPILYLVASMAVLLSLSWPVQGMRAGAPGIDNLSPTSDSRIGLELFADQWGAGEISPIYVVIQSGNNSVWRSDFRDALAELGQQLKNDPRVARVESIAELGLPRELPSDPSAGSTCPG